MLFPESIFELTLIRRNMTKQHTSRSRPVSCCFCRSRKLRCSRQFPCSNCTTRGVDCQSYTLQPSTGAVNKRKNYVCKDSESEIIGRLRRLEDIVTERVVNRRQTLPEVPETDESASAETQSHVQHNWQSTPSDAEWLERECIDQSSSVGLTDRASGLQRWLMVA